MVVVESYPTLIYNGFIINAAQNLPNSILAL